MGLKLIAKTLVYEYAGLVDSRDSDFGWGDGWQIADPEIVASLFRGDPRRERSFRQFLDAQHSGLILVRGGRWVAYGWCCNPRGVGSSAPTALDRYAGSVLDLRLSHA